MTVKFDVDGHSNASGGNGAGKTSALNLIPIFYGTEPSLLVDQIADKDSFLDFYLPKQSSAIIFEHEREDGFRLVVMYRHTSGSKVIYRFVRGGLEETLFSPEIKPLLESGVSISDIFHDLRVQNITISKQLDTITDYRSIIQNDRNLLQRKGSNAGDVALAREYCIGGANDRMSHLDRMSYSILRRKDMFERLKKMIAETQFKDIHINSRPEHLKDKTLIQDIAAIRDFTASEGRIRDCIENNNTRLLVVKNRDDTASQLKARLVEANNELSQLATSMKVTESKLVEEKEKYETETETLRNRYQALKSETSQLDRDIKAIYKDHDAWINEQNIHLKKAKYSNLQQEQQRLDNLKTQLDQLTQQVKNLEGERDTEKYKARGHRDQIQNQINIQRNQLVEELRAGEQEKSEVLQVLSQDKQKAIDSLNGGELSQRLKELNSNHATAKVTANTYIERSLDIQELTNIESSEFTCLEQIDKKRESLKILELELDLIKKQRISALDLLDQAKINTDKERGKLNSLQAIAYPNDGTLLSEFRRENLKWTESIGRIINKDLLLRSDLEPEYIGSTDTVFGWSLLLEKIDIPDHCADNETLAQRLDQQEGIVRNAEKTIVEREAEARAIQTQLKELDYKIKPLRHDIDELTSRLRNLRNEKKKAKETAKQNAIADQRAAKNEMDRIAAEIIQTEIQINEKRSQINHRFSEHHQEINAKYQMECQRIQHKKEQLEESLEKAESDFIEQLKRIEKRYSEDCIKNGMNPDDIRELRGKVNHQTELVHEIKDYWIEIEKFDHWSKVRWDTRETIEEQLRESETARNEAQENINSHNKYYSQKRNKLKQQLSIDTSKHKELEDKIRQGTSLVNQCPLIDEIIEPQHPFGALILDLERHIKRESQLCEDVLNGVSIAQQILQQYVNSRIYKAWQMLLDQRKMVSGLNEFDVEFRLNQPNDLAHLLDNDVPDLRDLLIEQVRAVGDSLSKYHDNLNSLNKEVDRVSRHLGKNINANQRIENLTNIELQVTSVVKEGDYWRKLSEFNRQWVDWCENRDFKLPPNVLLESIQVANDALQNARIKSDINSLIRLRICLEENGRKAHATSAAELDAVSSNGISYLAILVIFKGMARYLCPNLNISLHWPIDELAALSPENVARVFAMFDEAGIYCFSAFPSTDPNLLKFFKHRKLIDRRSGVRDLKEQVSGIKRELSSRISELVVGEAK